MIKHLANWTSQFEKHEPGADVSQGDTGRVEAEATVGTEAAKAATGKRLMVNKAGAPSRPKAPPPGQGRVYSAANDPVWGTGTGIGGTMNQGDDDED